MILTGRKVKQDGNNPHEVTDEEYTFTLKQIAGGILLAGPIGPIEVIRVEALDVNVTGKIHYIATNTITQSVIRTREADAFPLTVEMLDVLLDQYLPDKNNQGYRVYKTPEHKKLAQALEKTKQILERA